MSTGKYVLVDSRKVHFHMMGKGPSLLLFHPSPHTSEILLPLAKELASHYTVFSIDTPGYGKSDALGFEPNALNEYTDFLHKALKEMGLKQPVFYGSATGAQIAIRYALEYPDDVSCLFLDNAAHFDDALRSQILQHYFPDLSPQLNGNHLTQIWTMVSQMFQYFPWCFTTDEYALNRPQLPAAALHYIAIDYLKAGKHYDYAYKAAFQQERATFVQQLKVPTTIFRWNNSIITRYVDDLLAFEFPPNVSSFEINGDPTERMHLMTQFIKDKAEGFLVCQVSEKIKPYADAPRIAYLKENNHPPKATADGLYLKQAWDALVLQNPTLSAEEIQACLVDWYTNPN